MLTILVRVLTWEWTEIGPVLHGSDDPDAWNQADVWAPEVVYRNGTFYLYYTASKASPHWRVGGQKAVAPAGHGRPHQIPRRHGSAQAIEVQLRGESGHQPADAEMRSRPARCSDRARCGRNGEWPSRPAARSAAPLQGRCG